MPDAAVHVASGKVRELFELDAERLLLVASDRISTFDVVLPTEIPDKGRVLTGLSALLVRAHARRSSPNHLLALRADGRSTECRGSRCCRSSASSAATSTGSGWKDYQATGVVCGHELPEGLRESDQAAGADLHALDEGASRATTRTSTASGPPSSSAQERFDEVERASLELYRFASEHAAERGILIADTKFEFGLDARRAARARRRGASRPTRPASGRPTSTSPGGPQPSFDKQFVRDYCESLGWDKTAPGPGAPGRLVAGTRARYVEAFERLTGIAFDDYLADPEVVLA